MEYKTLTVYLGSSGHTRPVFRDAAIALGEFIGREGKQLVYGGMDAGLMGLVANSALRAGAKVTGIIPKKLKDSERIHPALQETILVQDLWERKLRMFHMADAIIVLPGGFGTMDEALEALYWSSLGLHTKPVVFVNIEGYWDNGLAYICGLPDFKPESLLVADNVEDVFHILDGLSNAYNSLTAEDSVFPHFEDEILSAPPAEPLVMEEPSLKNSYRLVTALGLKQLARHERPIGLLNTNDVFHDFLLWLNDAAENRFITSQCLALMIVETDRAALLEKLSHQEMIVINLDRDKWGPGEAQGHIEIREKG